MSTTFLTILFIYLFIYLFFIKIFIYHLVTFTISFYLVLIFFHWINLNKLIYNLTITAQKIPKNILYYHIYYITIYI